MKRQGFVLPFSIILALVVLTSLGLWFRQVVLQGYLAERLLLQRSRYLECRSLLPALKERLDGLSLTDLNMNEEGFLQVDVDGRSRWRVDRSAWAEGRVRFYFRRAGGNDEPLVLMIPYERKTVSGLPPDFSTEGWWILEAGSTSY